MSKLFLAIFLSSIALNTFASEKELFSLNCTWEGLDPKDENSTQKFIVYKNESGQRLEITPAKNTHIAKPVYVMKAGGAYTSINGKDYFKEYYWRGADFRLTMLRGERTEIIIESISSPDLSLMKATCTEPKHN